MRRSSIAWKLSAAVIVIVSGTLLAAFAADHLLAEHGYHQLARAICRFDTRSTVSGLDDLLMRRSLDGVESYFSRVAVESTTYGDLKLIAHEPGEIVASLNSGRGSVLSLENRSCAVCHELPEPSLAGTGVRDEILVNDRGERVLAVLSPILNEPGCQTAECHAAAEPSAILGFLQAEYALGYIDPTLAYHGANSFFIVIGAVALSVLTITLLFQRLLRRPIQKLIDGTQRLAEGDREFRFPGESSDELGELERAFNSMADRINRDASELSEAKDYLEGVIENSAAIIITVSLEHQIRTFNAGAERALGYTRDEVIGERMRMLFARPEDRDRALKILESTNHVQNFATEFRTKSGETRDVLLTLSRLRDREGKVIGTFGISKDITKEKELFRQLIESKDYLESVIESSADIIITVSLEHRIQTFNMGAEQALGYRRDEVIGERMRVLFARPEDRDEALKLLENQDNVLNFETKFRTKSGEICDVLLTLSRLRDREGNMIGTFGISKDITKEKELLRQLIQSKKLIAIGQAVTGINHATKNMLSALQGGAYLVRSGMKNDNRERLTEGWAMVEDGIERISGLSQNLLSYARGWTTQLASCDLNDLVVGVAESLIQKGQERGVTIRGVPKSDLEPVRCDAKLIRTAVMDIASNAIDACDEKEYGGGEVPEVVLEVFVEDDPGQTVIEIRDNGCGMDELTIQRVFEPFFSTKEDWGTGVGLAMTSRVIEEHGGRCDVESKLGEGSTFRIVLPIASPEQSQQNPR